MFFFVTGSYLAYKQEVDYRGFRNVNGELPVGGYCPIAVPAGENFPRSCPREDSRGAFLPHPRPRSGI